MPSIRPPCSIRRSGHSAPIANGASLRSLRRMPADAPADGQAGLLQGPDPGTGSDRPPISGLPGRHAPPIGRLGLVDPGTSMVTSATPIEEDISSIRDKEGEWPHRKQIQSDKRAVSYLRVSTQRQADTDYNPEGFSIPTQRNSTKQGGQVGATIVEEFVEPGGSGRNINRKAMQQMFAYLARRPTSTTSSSRTSIGLPASSGPHNHQVRDRADGRKACLRDGEIDDGGGGTVDEGLSASSPSSKAITMSRRSRTVCNAKRRLAARLARRQSATGTFSKTSKAAPCVWCASIRSVARSSSGRSRVYATGQWGIRRLTDALDSRGLRTNPSSSAFRASHYRCRASLTC